MQFHHISKFNRGWIVGKFSPSLLQSDIEVAIMPHSPGSKHDRHYHKHCTEINTMLDGACIIRDFGKHKLHKPKEFLLEAGDIFIVEPYEIIELETDIGCRICVVKTSSVKDDKYII